MAVGIERSVKVYTEYTRASGKRLFTEGGDRTFQALREAGAEP